MNTAIVGLGSNIDPEENIQRARDILRRDFSILKESHFIKTKPVGRVQQSDYINGAVLISTDQNFKQLKNLLKGIEQLLGRQPQVNKFSPRTIDLDILVWNEKVVDQDFYTRNFVKESVLELIPSLKFDLP